MNAQLTFPLEQREKAELFAQQWRTVSPKPCFIIDGKDRKEVIITLLDLTEAEVAWIDQYKIQ